MRLVAAVVALALIVSLAGCSSGDHQGPAHPPDANTDDPGSSQSAAEARYGVGPKRDPRVELKPDVVLIEGGPEAIKSASADGMIWTMDGEAGGVKDLAPGKIMFASSMAVGRVVAIVPTGGDYQVLLAPIELADLIQSGSLDIDQPLDLSRMAFQEVPDQPGTTVGSEPQATESPDRLVAPKMRFYDPPGGGWGVDETLPPPKVGANAGVQVGNWKFTLVRQEQPSQQIGLDVTWGGDRGQSDSGANKFSFTEEIRLDLDKPRVQAQIAPGQSSGSAFLAGIRAVRTNFRASTEDGTYSNQHKLPAIEVPIDLVQHVGLVYGVPMTVKISFKFLITFGFTAKHTMISAETQTLIDGTIGAKAGGKVRQAYDALDKLTGTGLGMTGIVMAFQLEGKVGVGIPDAMVGPYGKLTLSTGFTYGSPMGAPVTVETCKAVTIKVDSEVGVGLSVSRKAANAINGAINKGLKAVYGKPGVKTLDPKENWLPGGDAAGKAEATLYNHSEYKPAIAACKP